MLGAQGLLGEPFREPFHGLSKRSRSVVAWSGVGGGDAAPLQMAVDLAPLETLVVAWSALVAGDAVPL